MSEIKLSSCRDLAITMLAAVFIAGGTLGAVGMRMFEHSGGHDPGTIDVGGPAVQKLIDELSLTADQAERVKLILDESIMMEADHLDQIQQIRENGRRRILEILDQDQRLRFETQVYPVAH